MDLIATTAEEPDDGVEEGDGNVLCVDMWLKIFRVLKLRDLMPLRKVCQEWNVMIKEHILMPRKELIICLVHYSTNKFFRKEHISDCYYVQNYRQLILPLQHHRGLHSLKVFNFLVGQWLLSFNFPNLTSICFNDCTFTITMSSLADHLKDITRLEIINSELTDEHIRIIGQNMRLIEHLNVSFNNQLTGTHLESLSATVKSLNLGHCLRLNDYKLCYSLQELLTKGAQLEALNLKPLDSMSSLPLTTFFVFTTLPHLKVLKLNCMPDLNLLGDTSRVMTTTVEKLTLIGRYDANSQQNLMPGDRFLKWFFSSTKFDSLQHLNLTDFSDKYTTDEGTMQCFYSCPNITHLKLNGLPFLTSKSLDFIPEMKLLKCVKFVNINLNDQLIVSILKQCKHLNKLIIDFLDNGQAKPYNLTEAIIHECIHLCNTFPQRRLKVKISKSLLPTHKLFTIPSNLTLEIIRSRFLIRKQAIYVDEPVEMY